MTDTSTEKDLLGMFAGMMIEALEYARSEPIDMDALRATAELMHAKARMFVPKTKPEHHRYEMECEKLMSQFITLVGCVLEEDHPEEVS